MFPSRQQPGPYQEIARQPGASQRFQNEGFDVLIPQTRRSDRRRHTDAYGSQPSGNAFGLPAPTLRPNAHRRPSAEFANRNVDTRQ